jgi:hypothetical protein
MLGDPRYQAEIMGDEHQREALPPQIVGQSRDDFRSNSRWLASGAQVTA